MVHQQFYEHLKIGLIIRLALKRWHIKCINQNQQFFFKTQLQYQISKMQEKHTVRLPATYGFSSNRVSPHSKRDSPNCSQIPAI